MRSSKTAIIIPIKKFDYSKTRLGSFLNPKERKELTKLLMLETLEKVSNLQQKQIIVVSGERFEPMDKFRDIVLIEESNLDGVNNAIRLANRFIKDGEFSESLVIPIDLPFLSAKDLSDVVETSRKFEKGICIVPSKRFDGTNVLLRKPNLVIDTFYDNNSFHNHVKIAAENNVSIEIIKNENLMIDLDTVDDVIEIMGRYNTVLDGHKTDMGMKGSKSIVFLKDRMKDRLKKHT
ncbi:MAG: 2-phospho-L-lactate guanylyltransferase [Candidatus Nitrosocosmicus sp.]